MLSDQKQDPNLCTHLVYFLVGPYPPGILLFRHSDHHLTCFTTGVIHRIASILEVISPSTAEFHRENLAFTVKTLMPKFTFSN